MFLSKIPQELSPLSPEQTAHVQQLAGAMTPVQQAWVSGYLAASANNNRATMPVVAAPVVADTLTVLRKLEIPSMLLRTLQERLKHAA